MIETPEEVLIEAASTAWRPRGRDGSLRAHAAWHDLTADGRLRAFEAAQASRVLEAAIDPDGFSSTVHAVMARILR